MPRVTGVVAACACGEVYELMPVYAGRLLECPRCRRHLRAGRAPGAARVAAAGVDPAFDRDVFLLRQRALSIASKYEVWSEAGAPVLYVERPTYPVRTAIAYGLGAIASFIVMAWVVSLAGATGEAAPLLVLLGYGAAVAAFIVVSMSARPLRHVTVYRDESQREPMLRIRQDQRWALAVRTYTVVTAAGESLARLRKNYVHNLLRKRWYVETLEGSRVAMAIEESAVLSLLRRVLGPLFGVLRTNFLFVDREGAVLGEFNRKLTLLDRYVLDLTADAERALDRRVALALGIMLDSGERR